MKVSIKYIIAGYIVLIAANALVGNASAIIRDNERQCRLQWRRI